MKAGLAIKLERASTRLRDLAPVVVAYSGGVDSSLVLELSHRSLGPACRGIIARSPSLPAAELEAALALARGRGIRVDVLDTREVELEGYRRNAPDRCYFCKSELYSRLGEVAKAAGGATVVDGFNVDDRADWRPGRRAAAELGVLSPLDEAGLGKAEVREAARELGLPNWDKPEAACLSSRVEYGIQVDASLLGRVARAEAALQEEGFRQVRVRHMAAGVSLEVEPALVPRLLEPERLARVRDRLAQLGYRQVRVDPGGYRKGNLNRAERVDAPATHGDDR